MGIRRNIGRFYRRHVKPHIRKGGEIVLKLAATYVEKKLGVNIGAAAALTSLQGSSDGSKSTIKTTNVTNTTNTTNINETKYDIPNNSGDIILGSNNTINKTYLDAIDQNYEDNENKRRKLNDE